MPVDDDRQSGSDEEHKEGQRSKATPSKRYPEDTDNRKLWDSSTRYDRKFLSEQRFESWYILMVLLFALGGLVAVGVGGVDRLLIYLGMDKSLLAVARQYQWLALGGLLGGVVYSAKWLYHAVAKGLWHEDRKIWRYLSPWISVGTTVGVGALLVAGFLKVPVDATTTPSGSMHLGLGFLIGYFSDMFLAKMKEVTRVIFGETESHFKGTRDKHDPQ